jgi:DNA-binding NarL/FixJ family response regulator
MSDSPPRLRLLLADDFVPFLTSIMRFLARHEFEVVGTVASGAQLLDAASALHPDAILVDLNMPGLNGLQACRLLKQTIPGSRIIVLTADTDPDVAQRALAAGAAAVVTKQFIGRDLVAAIQTACGPPAA